MPAPTAAAAAAANLLASQTAAAAAAATIVATLPSVLDSQNLPTDVRIRFDDFMNPSTIVTQSAMIPFTMPTGGCGPVLSYLDPTLGAGVPRLPTDANQIITSNGQFASVTNQGTPAPRAGSR